MSETRPTLAEAELLSVFEYSVRPVSSVQASSFASGVEIAANAAAATVLPFAYVFQAPMEFQLIAQIG